MHGVLAAGVDVRVVVHLDHEEAPVDLLHVDAVEPVADQARRAHGDPHRASSGTASSGTRLDLAVAALAAGSFAATICQCPRAMW